MFLVMQYGYRIRTGEPDGEGIDGHLSVWYVSTLCVGVIDKVPPFASCGQLTPYTNKLHWLAVKKRNKPLGIRATP